MAERICSPRWIGFTFRRLEAHWLLMARDRAHSDAFLSVSSNKSPGTYDHSIVERMGIIEGVLRGGKESVRT